jgi:hypothetical protein
MRFFITTLCEPLHSANLVVGLAWLRAGLAQTYNEEVLQELVFKGDRAKHVF